MRKKVLWERTSLPDNHLDLDRFLADMVISGPQQERKFWHVSYASIAITQQVSTAVIGAAVPAHLIRGDLDSKSLLVICLVLLATGYLSCYLLGGHILGGSLKRGVRQCLLMIGSVYFLSPLLRSLTRTVSTDSAIVLIAILLLVHVFTHDYNFVNDSSINRLTGVVSLSTGMLSSTIIASLLPSDLDVFAQVLFSLILYLLSPFVRRYVNQSSSIAHISLGLLMVCGSSSLLFPLSPSLFISFIFLVLAITFLGPYWLIKIRKFKAHISGPWDEAMPDLMKKRGPM